MMRRYVLALIGLGMAVNGLALWVDLVIEHYALAIVALTSLGVLAVAAVVVWKRTQP